MLQCTRWAKPGLVVSRFSDGVVRSVVELMLQLNKKKYMKKTFSILKLLLVILFILGFTSVLWGRKSQNDG